MTVQVEFCHLEFDTDEIVRGLSLASAACTGRESFLARLRPCAYRAHKPRCIYGWITAKYAMWRAIVGGSRSLCNDHQKAADYTVTHTRFAQYELLLASVLASGEIRRYGILFA